MEVDLAEAQNSYEVALINQESALNSFKDLLGIELTDSVILKDDLEYTIVTVDADKAVEYALKNRTELRERDIAIEQQAMSIRQRKAEGMVRGYFDAYVQKTGTSMGDITTTYGNTIQFCNRGCLCKIPRHISKWRYFQCPNPISRLPA